MASDCGTGVSKWTWAGEGSSLPGTSRSVLKKPKTEMTHSVNIENTGIFGVGRDISMVLGVSLKRPRAPGSLRRELAI
jgi:hypothetical protein